AHSVTVRVTDRAGNTTTATRSFTLSGWSRNPTCGDAEEPPAGLPRDVPPPSGATTATAPTVARSVQRTKALTKLRKVRLVNAPKGAKVKVTCSGGGCPKAKRALKLTDVVGRRLKPGARVTIKVGSHTIKIKIRAKSAPLVT